MFDQNMMQQAAFLLVAIALVLASKDEDSSPAWRQNAMPGPIKEPTAYVQSRRATKKVVSYKVEILCNEV